MTIKASSPTISKDLCCNCGPQTNHAGISPNYKPSFIHFVNTIWHHLEEANKNYTCDTSLKVGMITVVSKLNVKTIATVEICRSAHLKEVSFTSLFPFSVKWRKETQEKNYTLVFID